MFTRLFHLPVPQIPGNSMFLSVTRHSAHSDHRKPGQELRLPYLGIFHTWQLPIANPETSCKVHPYTEHLTWGRPSFHPAWTPTELTACLGRRRAVGIWLVIDTKYNTTSEVLRRYWKLPNLKIFSNHIEEVEGRSQNSIQHNKLKFFLPCESVNSLDQGLCGIMTRRVLYLVRVMDGDGNLSFNYFSHFVFQFFYSIILLTTVATFKWLLWPLKKIKAR